MLPYEDERSLALLYHLNSEPWMNLPAYSQYAGPMAFSTAGELEDAIALPASEDSPLLRLLAARRSCRDFTDTPIATRDLATLLHTGYGIIGRRCWPDGFRTFQRAVPSAGGLYPLELFVVARAVEGLEEGLYHYDARHHRLEPWRRRITLRELIPILMNQGFVAPAAVVVLLAAVFARTMRKYGPRGYRYVLFEAGHVAQNICLSAVERGLGSLCLGGFHDGSLNRTLGLDPRHAAVLYGVAVGHVMTDTAAESAAPV